MRRASFKFWLKTWQCLTPSTGIVSTPSTGCLEWVSWVFSAGFNWASYCSAHTLALLEWMKAHEKSETPWGQLALWGCQLLRMVFFSWYAHWQPGYQVWVQAHYVVVLLSLFLARIGCSLLMTNSHPSGHNVGIKVSQVIRCPIARIALYIRSLSTFHRGLG